jgi:hypothetical protein
MPQSTPEPTTQSTPDIDPKRRYRCRHVFTQGHRCGSPSLRGEDLCYYHHASRREPQLARHNGYFLMPRIDDRPAIQIAIYDVLARLSQFDIDPKRAGMFLYGLQIASANLAKHEKSAANTEPIVEEIIPNPFLGDLAPIAEMPETPATESGAPGSTALSSTLGLPPAETTAPSTASQTKVVPEPSTEVVILRAAKNPRIPPDAPQISKETTNRHPTASPLHTIPSPQPITLAATAHQTARTRRKLKFRTSNLEPGTWYLEPSTAPPPHSPIHNALQ